MLNEQPMHAVYYSRGYRHCMCEQHPLIKLTASFSVPYYSGHSSRGGLLTPVPWKDKTFWAPLTQLYCIQKITCILMYKNRRVTAIARFNFSMCAKWSLVLCLHFLIQNFMSTCSYIVAGACAAKYIRLCACVCVCVCLSVCLSRLLYNHAMNRSASNSNWISICKIMLRSSYGQVCLLGMPL